MTEIQLRAQMCEVGRRLWQRGLVGATEGNISVRLSSRRLLCTPSGLSKGHMRPEDLVIIDLKGQIAGRETEEEGPVPSERRPSSEIKLHLRIFEKRPDCVAVVHAHPPTATAFALSEETIPDELMPESAIVLGSVATVPFAMPGTDEVPDSIEPLLEDHKTFLLSHHGAVVMGSDLFDAYHRMETLERVANVLLMARLLGGPAPMPEAAAAQFRSWLHGKLR